MTQPRTAPQPPQLVSHIPPVGSAAELAALGAVTPAIVAVRGASAEMLEVALSGALVRDFPLAQIEIDEAQLGKRLLNSVSRKCPLAFWNSASGSDNSG